MTDQLTFGDLLRRHRIGAGLTQQALAERAALSLRGLSDLERGARRAPYRDTVRRLSEALGLSALEQESLLRAGGRHHPQAEAEASRERRLPALPLPLTSFVGREREIVEVRRLLATTRLLTLTGTGGIGKTRLALQAVAELGEAYPHGVWLVDLAPLADAALVAQAVATSVGVREQPGRPLQATLADAFRHRRLLLLLDNCEHLVVACAELAEALLRACPHLRILATSREVLRIAGEAVWRVPSLGLPSLRAAGPTGGWRLENLDRSDAVQLFIARAVARLPGFALTQENAPTLGSICHQLDGLPLAIELAAARVSALSLEQLSARLPDPLRLLTRGARTAPPRHQTLRATLEWSYAVLPESEQRLFERLAVFAGGWTPEAAEAVGAGMPIDSSDVLDLLGSLIDKSLVVSEEIVGGTKRYRLLETVRQYAWECLAKRGAADAVQRRHATFFLALAEQVEPELRAVGQGVWLGRLDQDHDNLRAALRWTLEAKEAELGLRLAGALWRFWWVRGHLSEGRRWLDGLLAISGDGSVALTAHRAKVFGGAGALASDQSDYSRATALLEQSLALFRIVGEKWEIAWILNNLARVARNQGDYSRAAALSDEGLAVARDLGDKWAIAWSLSNLGFTARDQGDSLRAAALLQESLALFRELDERWGIGWSLKNLGLTAMDQGDCIRAAALLEGAMELFRELDDQWGIAASLAGLGAVALQQGDSARASALLQDSLAVRWDLGEKQGIAECLEGLARVATLKNESEPAVRLFGAAQALRETIGAPLPAANQPAYDRSLAAAAADVTGSKFDTAWTIGRAMSPEQAVAYALRVVANVASRGIRRRSSARLGGRELVGPPPPAP